MRRRTSVAVLAVALMLGAAVATAVGSDGRLLVTPSASAASGRNASGCRQGRLPDRRCTPGATFHVSARQVCASGYSRRVRDVPDSEKRQVYSEYGIRHHKLGQYEVDHLIPLELGGSNSIRNLWPEAANPRPGP